MTGAFAPNVEYKELPEGYTPFLSLKTGYIGFLVRSIPDRKLTLSKSLRRARPPLLDFIVSGANRDLNEEALWLDVKKATRVFSEFGINPIRVQVQHTLPEHKRTSDGSYVSILYAAVLCEIPGVRLRR